VLGVTVGGSGVLANNSLVICNFKHKIIFKMSHKINPRNTEEFRVLLAMNEIANPSADTLAVEVKQENPLSTGWLSQSSWEFEFNKNGFTGNYLRRKNF
jgi:hypothetical protein